MSTDLPRRALRKVASTIFNRKTVKALKRTTTPAPALQIKYFHAVARNEMNRTAQLKDVEYVVYYGEQNAISHYDMWNPVFEQRPGKTVSIFRHAASWWPLSEKPDVYPVATINQIGMLFERMPNLKAVFYPANNGVNMQAVRDNHLTHVFLGHGDSNKASSANKVFRLYDEVWIAGQAHRDRFDRAVGDYSAIKFRTVGQPWMRDWLNNLNQYDQAKRTQWGYFPTWRGYYENTNYSSLDLVYDLTNAAQECLGENATGFLKLHPWSTPSDVKSIESIVLADEARRVSPSSSGDVEAKAEVKYNKKYGLKLPDQTTQLRDILKKPLRFVICDISAALTECLYIDVPIFLYKAPPPALLADDFDEQHAFCYIYHDMDELRSMLDRVITKGDDYLAKKRRAAMTYFVDIEKTKTGHFYKELDNLPASPRG